MNEKLIKYEDLVDVIRRMHERGKQDEKDKKYAKDEVFQFFLSACESGNLMLCQAFLDAGVDINIRELIYGKTILLEFSSSKHFSSKVADWLIANGADINATGTCEEITNLSSASSSGNIVAAKYFIEKGIKINYMRDLERVIQHRQCEIVEMLLNLDAISMITAGESKKLFMDAVNYRCHDIVGLFLKNGISPNFYYTNKGTPLHLAVFYGDLATTKILLENNADVNAKLKTTDRIFYLGNKKFVLTPTDIAIVTQNSDIENLLKNFGGKASSKEEKIKYLSESLLECNESDSEYVSIVLHELKRLKAK